MNDDFKEYLNQKFPLKTGAATSYYRAFNLLYKYIIQINGVFDYNGVLDFQKEMKNKDVFEETHRVFVINSKSYYYKGYISRVVNIYLEYLN